ncbi:MAG: hypothetical protein FIA99_11750 [Ruminiclostridium sp.]|nr:hypothetical protein [Ruminiclostridium sp.]
MTTANWIQLLVPVISIVVAVVSAALTYYFAKKQQIQADERRLKEKCYLVFIEALSNNVLSDNIEEAKNRLSEAHNQILLIGTAQVADYIGPNNKNFSQEEHDRLATELIKSMRVDLYKNRAINRGYPIIGISGKHRRER